MILEWILFLAQSGLEAITILAIAAILNTHTNLPLVKVILYAAITIVLSAIVEIIQPQFYLFFSIVIIIVAYLIVKQPSRKFLGNYTTDILISIGIFLFVRLIVTTVLGLVNINLLTNRYAALVVYIALSLLFRALSSRISILVFCETWYLPYRTTILLTTASLLFLVIIIRDLAYYHSAVFSLSGATHILLIILGYLILNVLLGFSLIATKRVNEQNKAVIKYGDYLQNVVDWYREYIHDNKNHLQMLLALNRNKNGSFCNEGINNYIQSLINDQNRKTDTSIIKDSILISAMLNMKKEYAQQNRINLQVNIVNSLTSYNIPEAELIDILTNLINNAFEETEKLEPENRRVYILFDKNLIEVSNTVTIRVQNEGANEFFTQGYSSKGSGRGFGLSRVLSIAGRYNISVDKNLVEDWLTFRLEFCKPD